MAILLRSSELARLCKTGRNLPRFYSSCGSKKGLVLGVYSEEGSGVELTKAAEKYNSKSEGKLLEHIKLVQNEIKPGKSFVFWNLENEFQSVAVVGLGKKEKKYDDIELFCPVKEGVRSAASAGCKALDAVGIKDIHVETLEDPETAAEGSYLGTWKFQEYKSKKSTFPTLSLYEESNVAKSMWERGKIKATSQNFARKLADTPSNLLTPTIFTQEVEKMFKSSKVDVKVYDKSWAEKENMGAFLAVAKGSCEEPKFLELTYNQADGQPFVLIGKGVTFDAGGISIKPAGAMDEMRADMGGAAAVVSALYGLSSLNTQANIKVLVPLVENMPSGTAVKPGDVITAKNGKTICVDNTDAEGRLILADALCYSASLKPKWVLDIATLTGAMKVAIGNAATGVFTNSNELYRILEDASIQTGDRVWRFPLWKHFTKHMTSHEAYDINNIGKGGKGGGACTAAAFLSEFVPSNTPWLHLDMAGVMGPTSDTSIPYLCQGMTGRPTRTLIEFVEAQAKNKC